MKKEKAKYVVLNKEGLTGNALKEDTQVRIEGKGRKAGDTLMLVPEHTDTRYLIGAGWIKLAEKPKNKK